MAPQTRKTWGRPVVQLYAIVAIALVTDGAQITVTLLHTNDVHGRFEEFSPSGTRCQESFSKMGLCVGGIARQKTLANQVRSSGQHVLFLNAGDYYQGTLWDYLLGARIVADAVNYLEHDAMSLGYHEFDRGPKELARLLRDITVPILGCNLDFSDEPLLKDLPLQPSMTVRFGSELIGIIGFSKFRNTIDTHSARIRFTDETECVKREAMRLRQRGAKVIIAVGNSGFAEKKIAQAIPEVSVIVGGGDHVLLYSGPTINGMVSGDKPHGPYPLVVKRADGSRCLIVCDFWMGKYMGNLTVTWDDRGQPLHWSGEPTLLDNSVEQDAAGLVILDKYRPELQATRSTVVASTQVYLQGDKETLRYTESNMGNVMAEAFLKHFSKRRRTSPDSWSSVSAVFINSGAIRAPIEEGSITLEDVTNVLPYGNTMVVFNLTGAQLKSIVEQGVRNYHSPGFAKSGTFLQMAGMRVVYNLYCKPGNRVAELQILCAACLIPRFETVQEDRWYTVGTSKYIAQGGDNFDFSFVKPGDHVDTSFVDLEMAIEYLNASSPVMMGLDGRISFRRMSCAGNYVPHSVAALYCSLFLTALVFLRGP
ncbi:unnamed protein product [Ixodes hexagonus]